MAAVTAGGPVNLQLQDRTGHMEMAKEAQPTPYGKEQDGLQHDLYDIDQLDQLEVLFDLWSENLPPGTRSNS